MNPQSPIPARTVIPHRDLMLLIESLTQYRPGHAQARARIEPGHPFLDRADRLDRLALVEMLAQTAAALRGWEALESGNPAKAGYLVGVSDFEFSEQALAGDTLHAEVEEQLVFKEAVVLSGVIRRADRCLGRGALKVWEANARPPQPAIEIGNDPGCESCRPSVSQANGFAEKSPMTRAILERLEKIRRPEENRVVGSIVLDDKFPAFRGHFPAYSLLPGVVMIELALALAGMLPARPVRVTRIDWAKMSRQVLPGQTVEIEATLDPEAAGYKVKARLTGGKDAVASIVMRIEPTP